MGPFVGHGNNASFVASDLLEDGLGEVEVVQGRVAPAAGVVGECVIWWAEVGGSDHN